MSQFGPYELNQIYCCECSEGMSALPDNCIDLTITSPPYDSLRTYNGYTFDFEAIAAQLYRVTKPGGVGVWVVADETKDGSESGTSFRQALGFMAVGFNLHDTMIYQKNSYPAPCENRYYQVFEYMFVFSKGSPKTSDLLTVRSKGRDKSGSLKATTKRLRDGSLDNIKYDYGHEYRTRDNVWVYDTGYLRTTKDIEAYDHPAIFPEALARDHILSWSNPGDVVLDPMVGSGTTAKQAHLLGRHYLGFDISEEYCQLSQRRLAGVEAQPFLMPVVSEVNGKPTQAKLMP